jgi:hypothetical protein
MPLLEGSDRLPSLRWPQMRRTGSRVLAIVLCAFMSACGSSESGPTAPSAPGFGGQWTGTTAHGAPIAFTVSPDDKVTSITVGHSFNGCSGSQTFSNLSLETAPMVTCIPGPCPPGVSSFRSFSYAAGSIAGPSTTVNGLFPSMTRAEGSVAFRDFPGCGSVVGIAWTATKR